LQRYCNDVSIQYIITTQGKDMQCHEVDYEIMGDDLQVVEVELDPGETVIAEAGAMSWMEENIAFETKMGDGSNTSSGFFDTMLSAGKRMVAGESLFMTHFSNQGSGKKRIAFGAPFPGKIIPLNMAEHDNEIICQKDAFLCAALGTQLDISFSRKLGRGFFGGEGFIMERLRGDGMAFLHAGGTIVKKELKGETLFVDTGCLVAYTPGIDFDVQKAGNLKSMIFGGEGLFLATLRGHGTVYLQSLPFSRLAERVIRSAPSHGGSDQGEGSVLGGIASMFER
jgi:uncharacterized protein (TIGR00266 family)